MTKRVLVAAAAALLLGSGTARAAAITQGAAYPLMPTPTGAAVVMNEFDSALGTLTGVTFIRKNEFTLSNLEVVHNGQGSVSYELGAQFLYSLPGNSITDVEKVTEVFVYLDCPTPPGPPCSTFYNPPQTYSQTRLLVIPAVAWPSFIGTGTFDITYSFFDYELQVLGDPNFAGLNWDNAAGGYLELVYNYDPVPEPGSLALIGLGLTALGYVSRRRRS